MVLDEEEQEILDVFNLQTHVLVEQDKGEIERFKRMAENTLRKNKRVNIRMSENDLEAIQIRAIEEGIPYQTFIGSIIHKFITGRLVELRRHPKSNYVQQQELKDENSEDYIG